MSGPNYGVKLQALQLWDKRIDLRPAMVLTDGGQGPTQRYKNTQRNQVHWGKEVSIIVFASENCTGPLGNAASYKEKGCLKPFFPPTTMDYLPHRSTVVTADYPQGGREGKTEGTVLKRKSTM